MHISILVILMVFGIGLVVVIGVILIAVINALRRGRTAEDRRLDEEETRMMQEIYQGLEKMEKRVEALETLLLDRERKDET